MIQETQHITSIIEDPITNEKQKCDDNKLNDIQVLNQQIDQEDSQNNKTKEEFFQQNEKNNLQEIGKKFLLLSSWNICGLRQVKSKQKLTGYLMNYQPDIIGLNELKVDKDKFFQDNLNEDYYQYYFKYKYFNFSQKKGQSGNLQSYFFQFILGVAFFCNIKPQSVQNNLDVDQGQEEGRVIIIEYQYFYIIVAYSPNPAGKVEILENRALIWDTDLFKKMIELKEKKHVILMGDLNVVRDYIDIHYSCKLFFFEFFIFILVYQKKLDKCQQILSKSFQRILLQGFVDVYRELNQTDHRAYTYYPYSQARMSYRGQRLDYFVVNEELFKIPGAIEKCYINNEVYGSDHLPIELTLNLEIIKKTFLNYICQ